MGYIMSSVFRFLSLTSIASAIFIALLVVAAQAEDWPEWRHDARRTAATKQSVGNDRDAKLVQLWEKQLAAPTPAWPKSQPSLRFDVSYSPVAAEGLLFVPSMRDDTVRAFDLETGKERWRFTTDGPIRVAPAYADGRLYIGSDDGHLYCLNARDGSEVWRFDGTPCDRRILANERLISTWPIRSAPTLAEGHVHITNGVWPFMGIFCHCLDAKTGKLIWSNTAESSFYIQNPHGGAMAFSGFVPRGYPTLIDWKPKGASESQAVLAIPGGRTPPGLFDLTTGGLLEFNWAKKGSRAWNTAGDGRTIIAGGETISVEQDRDRDKCELILVGKRQKLPVDGRVWSLLAADGKLVAVTEAGVIHCFGKGDANEEAPQANEPKTEEPQYSDSLKNRVVLFLADGLSDLDQLSLSTNERGIILDANPKSVATLRKQLQDELRYGIDLSVYCGRIESINLPQYFAKRVVVLPSAMPKDAQGELVQQVWNTLHPYEGIAELPIQKDKLTSLCKELSDGKATIEAAKKSDTSLLVRSGGIPGASNWTHQYADAANSVVSKDSVAQGPLGLLWFGNGPPNDKVLPRHGHGPSPQVADGRLVIEGANMLRCYDTYTGFLLWQREFPGLGRYYDNTSHHPGANEIGSNYVTMPDAVYVLYGDSIHRLDPKTGVTKETFLCPAPAKDETGYWGMLAVEGDTLVATSTPVQLRSDRKDAKDSAPAASGLKWPSAYGPVRYSSASAKLVAMDRKTGKIAWSRDAIYGFRHNNIAASGDRLYVIDALSKAKREGINKRGISVDGYKPTLYALNLRTGAILWKTDKDVFGTFLNYSSEHDILLQAGSRARDRAKDESGVGMVAREGKTGKVLWRELDRSFTGPCLLQKDRIITQGPAYSLLTGEPYLRKNPVTDELSPWAFTRQYGCNTVIGSQNLLTFRSGAAGYYDLQNDGGTANLGGFKASCTSNMIVAGGLVNAPDYTRTCTCNYQNQTSLALKNDPSVEQWAFVPYKRGSGPIERIGFNFGAPGDRRAEDVLWIDTPSGGSASPDASIKLEPTQDAKLSYCRASKVLDASQWNSVNRAAMQARIFSPIPLDSFSLSQAP